LKGRVLVTGGTGFVGSHVVDAYRTAGWTVRALVRDRERLKWLTGPKIELAEGTLSDSSTLKKATADCDVVVHCAGLTKALSYADYHRVNAEATESITKIARDNGVRRFILCSSQAAAGPSRTNDATTEEDEPQPITDYGRSKLDGELYLRQTAGDMEWIVLRPPSVIGPRDEQFLPLFRMVARYGLYPKFGSRERRYSFISVHDLARAILVAGETSSGLREAYFIANDEPLSWEESARHLATALGRKARALNVPGFAIRFIGAVADLYSSLTRTPQLLGRDKLKEILTDGWICSPAKASRVLGFRCEYNAEMTLKSTLDFYQQAKWL
jgi:dihydroflavonol-4-reductase